MGIRYALEQGAAYIWLFNSDAIAPPDTLRTLVAAAETEPRAGLLAPLMRDILPPHPIMNLGGRFDRRALVYNYTDSIETATDWQTQFPDQIVLMGTALLIRRAVAERIGGFDEALFAYWEDIDYSIRSSAAGFVNLLVTETALLHPAKYPYAGLVRSGHTTITTCSVMRSCCCASIGRMFASSRRFAGPRWSSCGT